MTRRTSPPNLLSSAIWNWAASISPTGKAALYCGAAALLWLAGTLIGLAAGDAQALLHSSLGIAICFFGGMAALLVGELLPGEELALHRVLLGMLLRMGIPLLMILIIHFGARSLTDGGLPYYLLAYYLPLLALETWLSLPSHDLATAKEES